MADIGKILILSRGVYSATAVYNTLDVVRYNGKLWCCKQDEVSGVAPTESSVWTVWVQDGASGSGTGDMLKSVYDTDGDNIVDAAETLDGLTATITELNYCDGVTSAIQTQLNGKQNTLTQGANIDITNDTISADYAVVSKQSKGLAPILPNEVTVEKFLRQDATWAVPDYPAPNDGTLTITQNSVTVAEFSADSDTDVTADIVTDEWTSEVTVDSNKRAIFTGLDSSYGYSLPYVENKLCLVDSLTISAGQDDTVQLTFVFADAAQNDRAKLRILK